MNTDLESSLRTKIDFTEDDLNANRDGKLSDTQRHKLRVKQQGWLSIAGLAVVSAIFFFATIMFNSNLPSSAKLSNVTMICMFLALALLYVWFNWNRYILDLDRGIVFTSEGRLEPHSYLNRGFRQYELRVKNVSFPSDKYLFELLTKVAKDYPDCAVYYAPKSHILLSFETLDPN